MNLENTFGYDDGYRSCDCFWGTSPGSLVVKLESLIEDFSGKKVLDAGCGEGKNAAHLAKLGAVVDAIDGSKYALKNAEKTWGTIPNVRWELADVLDFQLPTQHYDVVILYGLLHCLSTKSAVEKTVLKVKNATKPGGYHLLCAFNSRKQELLAHPTLTPTLLTHGEYLELYSDYDIIEASDSDLRETHPDSMIAHTHSLTRLIARG